MGYKMKGMSFKQGQSPIRNLTKQSPVYDVAGFSFPTKESLTSGAVEEPNFWGKVKTAGGKVVRGFDKLLRANIGGGLDEKSIFGKYGYKKGKHADVVADVTPKKKKTGNGKKKKGGIGVDDLINVVTDTHASSTGGGGDPYEGFRKQKIGV
mgnify:CR=1 FL=1